MDLPNVGTVTPNEKAARIEQHRITPEGLGGPQKPARKAWLPMIREMAVRCRPSGF